MQNILSSVSPSLSSKKIYFEIATYMFPKNVLNNLELDRDIEINFIMKE